METLIQQATRLNQERYSQEQGKLGAFAGQVVSVTPISDSVGMTFGPAPSRDMPVQHPFVSQSSWLRSMPSVGTMYLMQTRFDTGQPEVIKTIPTSSLQKANAYQSGLNAYRPLLPGEHDIASSGYACGYFSSRGNLDLRSGASVKVQLNRDALEVLNQAPTHKINLLFQSPGALGDEVRYGIVKRWSSAAKEFYVKNGNNFVSEHYRHLLNPAGKNPEVLLRHIEGQVYDSSGNVIKHQTTALPLRSQTQWFSPTDEYLSQEIDEHGNLLFDFPSTASVGMEIQIPNGSYRKVIAKNRDVTVDQDDLALVQGNSKYTTKGSVEWDGLSFLFKTDNGGEVNLDSSGLVAIGNVDTGIELLSQISNSLSKIADWAMSFGATHTHIGNLGVPTSPPDVAADYIQLSTELLTVKQKIDSITGSL